MARRKISNVATASFAGDAVPFDQISPGLLCTVYVGPDIDCFASIGTSSVIAPAIDINHGYWTVTSGWMIVSKTGTITVSPIFKFGTNGAHDNLSTISTISSAAILNTASAKQKGSWALTLVNSLTPVPDLAGPLYAEITTQAAGTGSPSLVIRPLFVYAAVAI